MERIWRRELGAHVGRRVRLAGWLHHQRRLVKVTFLLLRDAPDRPGGRRATTPSRGRRRCLAETVLEVDGTVVANRQAPAGRRAPPTRSSCSSPSRRRRRRSSCAARSCRAQLPTLLDHAAVALRHPRRRASRGSPRRRSPGFRTTLDGLGFTEIHTPKLVASATEGGANVFPSTTSAARAYLAQSPQFYKQIMVGVFERVFEVGPVFRAEPHDTARHLNEYVSLDVELGFIEDHTRRDGGAARRHRRRCSTPSPERAAADVGPPRTGSSPTFRPRSRSSTSPTPRS